MAGYRYKLTLEVEDCGVRTYSGASEPGVRTQEDLARSLAWEVSNMLCCLNCPPTPFAFALAMAGNSEQESDNLLAALARLYEDHWDGNNGFAEAVKLTVNLDLLMPEADKEERQTARWVCDQAGFTVLPAKEPTSEG